MSDVNLSSFPKTRIEALTMLYLENQDLYDVTPEELVDMYAATYNTIKLAFRDKRTESSHSFL